MYIPVVLITTVAALERQHMPVLLLRSISHIQLHWHSRLVLPCVILQSHIRLIATCGCLCRLQCLTLDCPQCAT
jgi:hypothetical protein